MFNIFILSLIAIVIAVVSSFSFYNYAPLSIFDKHSDKLGTSITNIAGTDTISGSRTVINTNFSNLNTDKLENTAYYATTTHANISSLPALTSASSLATVGTITTGSWNATVIPVAKGGTGTTSPSTYMVMLGNDSNGLTMASTTGTIGQLLTSNGAGVYPSWQTGVVDTALDYAWTGNHNLVGTTYIKNLNASSTVANPIILNTVSYSTPAIQGASSTLMTNNGSGALIWMLPNPEVLLNDGSDYPTVGTATTTVTFAIPAGKMGVDDSLEIIMNAFPSGTADINNATVQIGTGAASTTIAGGVSENNAQYNFRTTLFNVDSTVVQRFWSLLDNGALRTTNGAGMTNTAAIETANKFYLSFSIHANAGTLSIKGLRVLLYRK